MQARCASLWAPAAKSGRNAQNTAAAIVAKPIIQYGMESRLPWLDELGSLPGRTMEQDDPSELTERIRDTNHQHPDHDTQSWPARASR